MCFLYKVHQVEVVHELQRQVYIYIYINKILLLNLHISERLIDFGNLSIGCGYLLWSSL